MNEKKYNCSLMRKKFNKTPRNERKQNFIHTHVHILFVYNEFCEKNFILFRSRVFKMMMIIK